MKRVIIREDGDGFISVSFGYDEGIIKAVRAIPADPLFFTLLHFQLWIDWWFSLHNGGSCF